ncbi:DUF1116 domain-containing protein [Pimelobacter simplex]|uniref:oxamate carbamoyltransferase subunit AllG family protein n=1 Tax=Nocardioides simplex TaxID=2045 RepID=UPI003AABE54A
MNALAAVAAEPVHLVGFGRAGDLWPALADPDVVLHAGPPLAGRAPTPAMLGALVGCLLFDGRARDADQARALIEDGTITLRSCHEVGGVGPMSGAVSAGVPVVVAERSDGRRAYAPVNEGLGPALRFGNFDAGTLRRLRHLAEVVAPALDRAVRAAAPIDLVAWQAAALRRGDEGHNRNVAATSMLATRLAPAVVATNETAVAVAALRELDENAHFFLPLSMAAAKAAADALHDVAPPGIVTAIASNGHGTGIRVSGLPGWFEGAGTLEAAQGVEGHEPTDFAPAMGDSPVTEVVGLGASAMSAAPNLARTLGWTTQRSREHVLGLRRISDAGHELFRIPDLDFAASPFAISVARVVETGHAPCFTTGFSHRDLGIGRAGFGLVRLPLPAFADAFAALSPDGAR